MHRWLYRPPNPPRSNLSSPQPHSAGALVLPASLDPTPTDEAMRWRSPARQISARCRGYSESWVQIVQSPLSLLPQPLPHSYNQRENYVSLLAFRQTIQRRSRKRRHPFRAQIELKPASAFITNHLTQFVQALRSRKQKQKTDSSNERPGQYAPNRRGFQAHDAAQLLQIAPALNSGYTEDFGVTMEIFTQAVEQSVTPSRFPSLVETGRKNCAGIQGRKRRQAGRRDSRDHLPRMTLHAVLGYSVGGCVSVRCGCLLFVSTSVALLFESTRQRDLLSGAETTL